MAQIERKTVSIDEYLRTLDERFRQKFLGARMAYRPKQESIVELRRIAGEYAVVVFSAAWCKDCAATVPSLALISQETGLKVRVFGGLKKDALNPSCKWRIPPSPPEVQTFGVDKIPSVIVCEKQGLEIGRILEKPSQNATLEEELLGIVKRHKTRALL